MGCAHWQEQAYLLLPADINKHPVCSFQIVNVRWRPSHTLTAMVSWDAPRSVRGLGAPNKGWLDPSFFPAKWHNILREDGHAIALFPVLTIVESSDTDAVWSPLTNQKSVLDVL